MYQIVVLLAYIIPAILFVLAQYRTLKLIRKENREMSPRRVWLQLIPVFGLVWQFVVVIQIAHSISKEMASKIGESILDNSPIQMKVTDESPTYTIGIAYSILTTLGLIINASNMHPSTLMAISGSVLLLSGIVCWIIYWVRLVITKNKLVGSSVAITR